MAMIDLDALWRELLHLKELPQDSGILAWSYGNNGFEAFTDQIDNSSSTAVAWLIKNDHQAKCNWDGWDCIDIPIGGFTLHYLPHISKETLHEFIHYWPLAVIHNYHSEKPFVIVHVASSLDGKIATLNGNSKWIGNPENLEHAHKLRALSKGVLVGANTVKNDSPKLNVRNVMGKNPVRFVISNESTDLTALEQMTGIKSYLLRNSKFKVPHINDNFDDVIFFESFDKICNCFKEKNISTLLIEGGSQTISSFLKEHLVDVIQIHYSPIILGSGKSVSDLPQIDTISDAIKCNETIWTPIGNSYMITAKL